MQPWHVHVATDPADHPQQQLQLPAPGRGQQQAADLQGLHCNPLQVRLQEIYKLTTKTAGVKIGTSFQLFQPQCHRFLIFLCDYLCSREISWNTEESVQAFVCVVIFNFLHYGAIRTTIQLRNDTNYSQKIQIYGTEQDTSNRQVCADSLPPSLT